MDSDWIRICFSLLYQMLDLMKKILQTIKYIGVMWVSILGIMSFSHATKAMPLIVPDGMIQKYGVENRKLLSNSLQWLEDMFNVYSPNILKFYKIVNSDMYDFENNNTIVLNKNKISLHAYSYIGKSYKDIFDMRDKDKKLTFFLSRVWKENVKEIVQGFRTQEACNQINDKKIEFESQKLLPTVNLLNAYIDIPVDYAKSYIGCELLEHPDKYELKAVIKTHYASYRYHNIKEGLRTLDDKIWEYGEILSLYDTVMTSKNYVDWYALFYNAKEKKVEEKKVSGGGLCGVSTVLYQAGVLDESIEIVERWPHMNFYTDYYRVWGLDATIYGEGKKAQKDTRMRNKHWTMYVDTFINTNYKTITYGVKYISFLPFTDPKTSTMSRYTGKGNRKHCAKNVFKNKEWKVVDTTYSCYINYYGNW